MKYIVKYLLLSVILIVISIYGIIKINKWIANQDKMDLANFPRTCGCLKKISSSKSGSYAHFYYSVGNKNYVLKENCFNEMDLGNYYSIAYNPKNPEEALVDWSEQRIKIDFDNITIFAKIIEMDTSQNPMEYYHIKYTYEIGDGKFEAVRTIKAKFYKSVSRDRMKCCLNPNFPQNSYLFWPGEEPLFCD